MALLSASEAMAICYHVLVRVGEVCTQSGSNPELCTLVYEWRYSCEDPGGGGAPGGGGGPGGGGDPGDPPGTEPWDDPSKPCVASATVALTEFVPSGLDEFASLRGGVAVSPPDASFRYEISGPGASLVGYGAGEVETVVPLSAVSAGTSTYTLTVTAPSRCSGGPWSSSAYATRDESLKSGATATATYMADGPDPMRWPAATLSLANTEHFSIYTLQGTEAVNQTWRSYRAAAHLQLVHPPFLCFSWAQVQHTYTFETPESMSLDDGSILPPNNEYHQSYVLDTSTWGHGEGRAELNTIVLQDGLRATFFGPAPFVDDLASWAAIP